MKFKLAIGDSIDVPVRVSLKDGENTVPFSFNLTAKRIDSERYAKAFSEGSDALSADVLREVVTGWRNQRLVLDDGKPVEFSAEAFDAMLSVVGMPGLMLRAYVTALVAAETPKGRAGN